MREPMYVWRVRVRHLVPALRPDDARAPRPSQPAPDPETTEYDTLVLTGDRAGRDLVDTVLAVICGPSDPQDWEFELLAIQWLGLADARPRGQATAARTGVRRPAARRSPRTGRRSVRGLRRRRR